MVLYHEPPAESADGWDECNASGVVRMAAKCLVAIFHRRLDEAVLDSKDRPVLSGTSNTKFVTVAGWADMLDAGNQAGIR
jgi:hypothetical protein